MEATPHPYSILLVCDSYPPVVGGSEIEAQRISAGLLAKGHKVEVLCAGGPPMPAQRHWIDAANVPVRILTNRSRGRLKNMIYACRVAWILATETHKYDLVYFLMQGLQLASGLPVARWKDKPILMKFGGSGVIPWMRETSRFGRLELDWLKQWSDRILVLNDGMVEEALAEGFDADRIMWMPNPVNTEEFHPQDAAGIARWRTEHDLPVDACIVIYVGRLSPEKGLPELLRGFAPVARQHPAAVLLLIGDGTQRKELEALARELEIRPQQIRFAGLVSAQEVPRWLSASDVFALTSPSEGFSCALVEAMASGLPSVVTRIPANAQLIEDGIHGLMIPWQDAAAAAEAFGKLFASAAIRAELGGNARQRVLDNYSLERVIERYEALFAGMMKGRKSVTS